MLPSINTHKLAVMAGQVSEPQGNLFQSFADVKGTGPLAYI